MVNVEFELRKLMDSYMDQHTKIQKERKQAKADGDIEALSASEAMEKQRKIMTTQLFRTMKALGLLSEEEITFGATYRADWLADQIKAKG